MTKNKHIDIDGICLSMMDPIRETLDVISGKWKMLILLAIMNGRQRFCEIENSIPKISPKVLAKELKEMEQHQLIKRTVYAERPVVIEYTPTSYSLTLKELMKALYEWGRGHQKRKEHL